MAETSVRALASVAPGASLASRLIQRLPRSSRRLPPGMTVGCSPMGIQRSKRNPDSPPWNPGGATPTTVIGWLLIATRRPSTASDAANRDTQ